ncbi:MAG: hypothetical protein NC548_38925 [Lachnospiraceae bacterium]|nr:hypothetical protein [Lachnospiraceae bacterium]
MSVIAASSSITHTYGNVACVALDYVKSYFTPNFFETVHMSTKMSYRQLDVFRAKHGFWVNPRPMLIMKPRIVNNDSSVYFYGSAITNRMTNSKLPVEFADRVSDINDRKHGVRLMHNWNRLRIVFDVAIIVNTFNQQANIIHSLKNRIAPETPYYIKTPLEACIPKGLIYPIAKHLGLANTNTPELLKYMNTYGAVPFTYKLKSGSSQDEFFMLYDTKIETIVSELSDPDEGDSRGMVTDTYVIPFSLTMDFYGVGTWYAGLVNSDHSYSVAPSDTELAIAAAKKGANVKVPDEEHIIPLMSIPMGFDLHLPDGWRILNSPCFFVSADSYKKRVDDVTDFADVIPNEFRSLIGKFVTYNKYTKTPFEPFIRFRCFKGRYELPEGPNGYTIDLDKLQVHVYDCDPKETYRLFVLVNTLMINTIASEVNGFEIPK